MGVEYLLPIFTNAIGGDDMEHTRQTLFAAADLSQPVPLDQTPDVTSASLSCER